MNSGTDCLTKLQKKNHDVTYQTCALCLELIHSFYFAKMLNMVRIFSSDLQRLFFSSPCTVEIGEVVPDTKTHRTAIMVKCLQ